MSILTRYLISFDFILGFLNKLLCTMAVFVDTGAIYPEHMAQLARCGGKLNRFTKHFGHARCMFAITLNVRARTLYVWWKLGQARKP